MRKLLSAYSPEAIVSGLSGLALEEHFASPVKPSKKTVLASPEQSLRHLLLRPFRLFKLRKALEALQSGTKFQQAGTFTVVGEDAELTSQSLPQLSKTNIQFFREQLRVPETGKVLRDDESLLLSELLDLDLICQHGTHHYYQILNARVLASATEIQRVTPDYEPTFSTKGNIAKLGNAGFIFFRVAGSSSNSRTTRYGDTRLISDLTMLQQHGWVSMHDQLLPFSKATEKTMRDNKIVLRTAEVANIKGTSGDKTMKDGIVYSYPSSATDAKTIKRFKELKPRQVRIPFHREMFYGPDIRLGIALSVIWQLRNLEVSGYRAKFLATFNSSPPADRTRQLETLIRSLYRIEAKYPVKLDVSEMPSDSAIHCEDVVDVRQKVSFVVDNPDGDGRYFADLSLHNSDASVAYAQERVRYLADQLSICRRQAANDRLGAETRQSASDKVAKLSAEQKTYADFLAKVDIEKKKLIADIHGGTSAPLEALEKIGLSKLKLLKEEFFDLMVANADAVMLFLDARYEKLLMIRDDWLEMVEGESVDIRDLLAPKLTTEQLSLITNAELYDLIVDDVYTLTDLIGFSASDLKELADITDTIGIKQAIVDQEYTPRDLLTVTEEELDFACNEDIEDIIIRQCPDWTEATRALVDDHGLQDEGFLSETLGDIHWREFCQFMGWDQEPESEHDWD